MTTLYYYGRGADFQEEIQFNCLCMRNDPWTMHVLALHPSIMATKLRMREKLKLTFL